MRVVLDFDDFSVLNNRLDLLLKLKEHYPKLKVSLFTIPFDYRNEQSLNRIYRDDALKLIKENLDWLQIIPHGLSHMPDEFKNADKTATGLALKSIDEAFKRDGLPYVKGFKAPFWLWNQDVVDMLDSHGWWGAVDRNQPEMLKTRTFYRYSHSIAEPFWESDRELLKLHGHIDGISANDIERCFVGLMKIPPDAEFLFANEVLEHD